MAQPSSWSLVPENPKTRRSLLVFCIGFNLVLTLLLLSRLQNSSQAAVPKVQPTRVPGIQPVIGGDDPFPPPKWAASNKSPEKGLSEYDPAAVTQPGGMGGGKNSAAADSLKAANEPNQDAASQPIGEGVLPEPMLGEKVAVVIETKVTPNLIPLMLHFSTVLGPSWKMVLFTMAAEWTMPPSIPFRRALADQMIHVKFLPDTTDFGSHSAVSEFLAKPWLWEQLQSAYRILLFQTDSVICSNSNNTIEDFLRYDLIGAPIRQDLGRGFNGGLSLRNPKLMLSVTTDPAFNFHDDSQTGRTELKFEDQWFYTKLSERGDALLPSEEIAKRFAVETIYYENPLGYHQPGRWQSDKMEDIQRRCPEVGMLIGGRY